MALKTKQKNYTKAVFFFASIPVEVLEENIVPIITTLEAAGLKIPEGMLQKCGICQSGTVLKGEPLEDAFYRSNKPKPKQKKKATRKK